VKILESMNMKIKKSNVEKRIEDSSKKLDFRMKNHLRSSSFYTSNSNHISTKYKDKTFDCKDV